MPRPKVKRKIVKGRLFEDSARVDIVRQLLSLGCYEHTIRTHCYYKWSLPPAKSNLLIRKAQKQLLSRTKQSVAEHKKDAIKFLDEMIRRDDVEPRVKLKAQEQKSTILGLNAPINIKTDIELRAEENRELAEKIAEENPEVLKEIIKIVRKRKK